VAVKVVIKNKVLRERDLWQKVKREVAILKIISHPHVLKIYDVYETPEHLYLLVEHMKGGELFDYILEKGRLDVRESLTFVGQLVDALLHCHDHDICHRDLKPENILLNETKTLVKLADFGLAQLMPMDHTLSTSCGSPHYASPEVILGKAYDGRKTDVWSLGVILYTLVTGSLPFDHDHTPTLLRSIVKGRYHMPDWVDPVVQDLISRMLVREYDARISLEGIRDHRAFCGFQHLFQLTKDPVIDLSRSLTGREGSGISPMGRMERMRSEDFSSTLPTRKRRLSVHKPVSPMLWRESSSNSNNLESKRLVIPNSPKSLDTMQMKIPSPKNKRVQELRSELSPTPTRSRHVRAASSVLGRASIAPLSPLRKLSFTDASCEEGMSSSARPAMDRSILVDMESLGFGNVEDVEQMLARPFSLFSHGWEMGKGGRDQTTVPFEREAPLSARTLRKVQTLDLLNSMPLHEHVREDGKQQQKQQKKDRPIDEAEMTEEEIDEERTRTQCLRMYEHLRLRKAKRMLELSTLSPKKPKSLTAPNTPHFPSLEQSATYSFGSFLKIPELNLNASPISDGDSVEGDDSDFGPRERLRDRPQRQKPPLPGRVIRQAIGRNRSSSKESHSSTSLSPARGRGALPEAQAEAEFRRRWSECKERSVSPPSIQQAMTQPGSPPPTIEE
jgi:serine/threonine protein kinase